MRKIRNLLLIAVIGSMSCMMGVSAVEYPTYQVGDLVKVTIPETKESKEFYVLQDGTTMHGKMGKECDLVDVQNDKGVFVGKLCDMIFLVEKDASLKNADITTYDRSVISPDIGNIYHRGIDFYERLFNDIDEGTNTYWMENRSIMHPTLRGLDVENIESICNVKIDKTKSQDIKCPSWLGNNLWLVDSEKYTEEDGKVRMARWAINKSENDKSLLTIKLIPEPTSSINDIKLTTYVHKKYVSKVEVEKPKTPATTTSNPKTGITNPLFIGGLSILGISGLILLIKKKNLFNKI